MLFLPFILFDRQSVSKLCATARKNTDKSVYPPVIVFYKILIHSRQPGSCQIANGKFMPDQSCICRFQRSDTLQGKKFRLCEGDEQGRKTRADL